MYSSDEIQSALTGDNFWLRPESVEAKIINWATAEGYVLRLSHTQAQWDEKQMNALLESEAEKPDNTVRNNVYIPLTRPNTVHTGSTKIDAVITRASVLGEIRKLHGLNELGKLGVTMRKRMKELIAYWKIEAVELTLEEA